MPPDKDVLGRRVLAALIDGIWLFLVGALLADLAWRAPMGLEHHKVAFGPIFAAFALSLVYFFIAELVHGRTLGKYLTGVRVVRDDGGAPTWRQVLARTLLRIPDTFAAGVVGLTSMLLTRPRRRLGDLAARTRVVAAPRSGVAGGVVALFVVVCVFRVAWAATPLWPQGDRSDSPWSHPVRMGTGPFVYLPDGDPEAVAARAVVHRYLAARTAGDGRAACALLTTGAQHDVYEKVTGRHADFVDGATCAATIVRTVPQSHLAGPDMQTLAAARLDTFRWTPVTLRVTGRNQGHGAIVDLLLVGGHWKIETQPFSLVRFITGCGLSQKRCGCIFEELRIRSDFVDWRQFAAEIAAAQSGRPTKRWSAARSMCDGDSGAATRQA